jgi:alanine-synthesizing transaminase
MSQENQIRPSEGLRHVKYEIRGRLARRAQELERQGYEIVPLNIGNPGAFGFPHAGDHAAGHDREHGGG